MSKNVIVDDINDLSSEMETFGIEIHKMAGYGIYAKGEEFDVRKALRHFCRIPISDKQVINDVDYRLCHDAAEIIANNFRSVNLRMAAGAVHHVESDTNIVFTDYTFQMLVEYISIGLFRYDVGKELLDGRFASEDIPDVNIMRILSSDKINEAFEHDCDLILSTIAFECDDIRFMQISPLVSSGDEKRIREKCFSLMTGQSAELSVFSNMIEDKMILFEKKVRNRKDIIKKAGQLLIDNGCVQAEFIKDVMEREKVESTEVGCRIAIPHGKPEHVLEPKIAVIRLENPIEWGKRQVDMIFMLAINFESVNTTKAFFHDFTKLLNENVVRERIREAKTPHELSQVIRSELGWN